MHPSYQPELLENQLETRTSRAINDRNWLKVDHNKKVVHISKIFDWYKKDFSSDGMTVSSFINKYRKSKIPSGYSVTYYEYDWSLNEG
ncbi:MAG: hypothetical protein R3345_10440 [Fulvivirga sp.]|nr:hypothetical protein [Fulvivirga sp.]